jgi:hypothetical protein
LRNPVIHSRFSGATSVLFAWLLAIGTSSCDFGALEVGGKRCDSSHLCPVGMRCVVVPISANELQGTCYPEATAPTCVNGSRTCSSNLEWVEVCEDGHSRNVLSQCAEGTKCNPDTALCAITPCEDDAECNGDETCDTGTKFCRPILACSQNDCPDGLCADSICIPNPSEESKACLPNGSSCQEVAPNLDCPVGVPPASPETCSLLGRVYLFPNPSRVQNTVGLAILLRSTSLETPVEKVGAVFELVETVGEVEYKYGAYQFDNVEMNATYEIEVKEGTSDIGQTFVKTINAGIGLRSNFCTQGKFNRDVYAMESLKYELYTSKQIPGWDNRRGFLFGKVMDCDGRPLSNATVGLAIEPVPPGRTYYFEEGSSALKPMMTSQATALNGYYAVAGLPACRNSVGFSIKDESSSIVSLGSVPFAMVPGAAVLINYLPSEDQRLP